MMSPDMQTRLAGYLSRLPDTRPADQEAAITAFCLWREARGEASEGRAAVAYVIRNRMADHAGRWPRSAAGVVLQHCQFSSFNAGDVNDAKFPLAKDPTWLDSCEIAERVIPAVLLADDPTYGSNFYHDISIDPPSWADPRREMVRIGRLRFYRL